MYGSYVQNWKQLQVYVLSLFPLVQHKINQ